MIMGGVAVFVTMAGMYVNWFYPRVGEAPSIQVPLTVSSIERGRYLANHVTVCMDCHSKRDWTVFSGPIVPGTEGSGGEVFSREAGFPGEIYSSNLTPHKLADWTDGELYRAICAGVGKDGRALFPLMAYRRFGQMAKEDVYSIMAYIRSLKPIEQDPPVSRLDFPVSLLNKLGPTEPVHDDLPDSTDRVQYGSYLVNAAGCVDCHSKVDKGSVVEGTEFGGGMEFRQPGGIIRAPNITRHETAGIGGWTQELFVQKFKNFDPSSHTLPKLGKDDLISPMPWAMYAGMTENDLEAIYVFLRSMEPKDNRVVVREAVGHP